MHPAAVIAGLIADNRRARAEFLPRLLLPVFAGRRIVVKCNCDQRPDGRDTGDMEFMEQGVHNTRQY